MHRGRACPDENFYFWHKANNKDVKRRERGKKGCQLAVINVWFETLDVFVLESSGAQAISTITFVKIFQSV